MEGGELKKAEKILNCIGWGGYLRIYQNSILSAYVPEKN
jgi:hypothetical protein